MGAESPPDSLHSESIEETSPSPETEDAPSASQKPTRRRTKTGCVTCRKRRIKCGEERPVCANCIKSRRRCEGYRPPIVFRRNIIDQESQHSQQGLAPLQSSAFHHSLDRDADQTSIRQQLPIFPNQPNGPQYQVHFPNMGLPSRVESVQSTHSVRDTPGHDMTLRWTKPISGAAQMPATRYNSQDVSMPKSITETSNLSMPMNHEHQLHDRLSTAYDSMSPRFSNFDTPHGLIQTPLHGMPKNGSFSYAHDSALGRVTETQRMLEDAAVEHREQSLTTHWPHTQMSERADQVYSAASYPMHQANFPIHSSLPTRQKHAHRRSGIQDDLNSRTIDHYRVEQAANPLNNVDTAKVFNYYRVVTAPMICPWSRNPSMTAETLHTLPVPILARNFFAYTVPILALQDQGLLHALLALTSLHIAKISRTSTTPALKHYSWSLKRVHHSVRNQTTRLNIATLTATLYLSMYEIMTADHGKWNTHLNGASQLMKEINFAELTASIYTLKHSRRNTFVRRFDTNRGWQDPAEADDHLVDELNFAQINEVDEDFICKLSGTSATNLYTARSSTPQPTLSIYDVQFYPVLQDIFWWFVKIDLIRAIIGGSPPMLSFQRIFEVPPRTAFYEQVHGAADHLNILLARLLDFSSKDRARKIKVADISQASPSLVQFYGLAPYTEQDHMPRAFRPRDSETTLPATSIPQPLETDSEIANVRAMKEWNAIRASFLEFEARLSSHYPSISDEGTSADTPFGRPLTFPTYQIGCLWAHYYMACILLHRLHPLMPPQHTLAIGLAAQQTDEFANSIGRIVAGMRPDNLEIPHKTISTAAFAECSMPLFVSGVQFQDNKQRQFLITRMGEIERLTGRASVALQAKGCEVVWQRAYAAGRGPPYEGEGIELHI